MKTRAITGFFFVLVMLASVLSGAYAFSIFFIVLAILSLIEFYRLIDKEGVKPDRLGGTLLGIVLFIVVALLDLNFVTPSALLYSVPLLAFIYIRELYRKNERPFYNIALTFLGVIYAVIPFLFFFRLGFLGGHYEYYLPMSFLFMLWANDTGAYLVGMKFGKTKLFERHSPKKTWEGFIGGVALSVGVSLILHHYYANLARWEWCVIAVIISVFGTWGDLTESMLKRSFQVKDSGSLLPGHGGLLDRFDGLLLAAPLVYCFLKLVA